MQVSISSTLTILHDGQFWVGICERRDGALYGACRFVFGPEPADEDVLAFVRDQWGRLDFRMRAEGVAPSRNPKRAQREAPGRPEDARRGAASLGATRTERAMFWQKSGLFRPEAAV